MNKGQYTKFDVDRSGTVLDHLNTGIVVRILLSTWLYVHVFQFCVVVRR
jgi:hypothetical protein